jgi:hypothetical protein
MSFAQLYRFCTIFCKLAVETCLVVVDTFKVVVDPIKIGFNKFQSVLKNLPDVPDPALEKKIKNIGKFVLITIGFFIFFTFESFSIMTNTTFAAANNTSVAANTTFAAANNTSVEVNTIFTVANNTSVEANTTISEEELVLTGFVIVGFGLILFIFYHFCEKPQTANFCIYGHNNLYVFDDLSDNIPKVLNNTDYIKVIAIDSLDVYMPLEFYVRKQSKYDNVMAWLFNKNGLTINHNNDQEINVTYTTPSKFLLSKDYLIVS